MWMRPFYGVLVSCRLNFFFLFPENSGTSKVEDNSHNCILTWITEVEDFIISQLSTNATENGEKYIYMNLPVFQRI